MMIYPKIAKRTKNEPFYSCLKCISYRYIFTIKDNGSKDCVEPSDENDLYQVQRDLNREIKILFDNNNIEIPFNQLVVHMAKDEEKEQATVREVRKAAKFAEEQKELSKELDIQKE